MGGRARSSWIRIAALGAALALAASAALVVALTPGVADRGVGLWGACWEVLRGSSPFVFFGAMALLPLLPIPLSPFYVAAGPIFGVGGALVGSCLAVTINMSLAHWAASGVLKPLLTRLVARLGYAVPTVAREHESQLTVLVRVAPGIPFFVQNLMVGIGGIGFWRNLSISLPIQMGWAAGFILLGESALEGSFGVALIAVGLLVALGMVTRIIRGRLGARPAEAPASADAVSEPVAVGQG